MTDNFLHIELGDWQKTPWYLRLIGKPKLRRKKIVCQGGMAFISWDYADAYLLKLWEIARNE